MKGAKSGILGDITSAAWMISGALQCIPDFIDDGVERERNGQ